MKIDPSQRQIVLLFVFVATLVMAYWIAILGGWVKAPFYY
ncbi:hypothetical protein ES703_106462 [subsurface metagenome]